MEQNPSHTEIRFAVDQKEAIRQGVNSAPLIILSVDVSTLSPEHRDVLSRRFHGGDLLDAYGTPAKLFPASYDGFLAWLDREIEDELKLAKLEAATLDCSHEFLEVEV